jgi:ATP-binding cassette subfamily B (MDR/TAP) protein 1
MLALSQNMFFLTDPDEIRRRANLYSEFYILLAGCALLSSTCQYFGIIAVGEKVSANIRSAMFESLMRRNIAFFDKEENSIGTLTTRLSDDSRTVNKAFGEGLGKHALFL